MRVAPEFDRHGFIEVAIGGLDDLELKERPSRITDALERFLPDDFIVTETDQPLIIDNAVHHMRANGETTPKVFKWKTATLKAVAVLTGSRRHPMRPITTRRLVISIDSAKNCPSPTVKPDLFLAPRMTRLR